MSVEFSIVRYKDEYKNEWDNHIRNSKNSHFFFLRKYIEYHQDRFNEHSLIIKRGNKVGAILPGNIEGNTFYSYQGLTFGGLIVSDKIRAANTGIIFDKIIEHLKNIGISTMVYKKMPHLYHQIPYEEDVYHLVKRGAELDSVEIGQVIDYDNYEISSTRENEINRARDYDLKIAKHEDYTEYWEILEDNLEKHGATPTHSLEEVQYLADNFPKNIKLFCAVSGDETLCGTVLFVNQNTVHTQYIGSSEKAHKYNALEYLLSEMIKKFDDKKYFSFGNSTEEKGKVLNKGLAFFKEGFGARGVVNLTFKLSI